MLRFASLFLVLGASVAVSGCDNPPVMPDVPIVVLDAPAVELSYLFGPCRSDVECAHLADGAICREAETGPTEGYCTVPCEDRTPCDAFSRYHHCLAAANETERYCVPSCRNGSDCVRESWSCAPQAGPGDTGVCVSVCESDAECGGTAVCNREGGICEAPPVDTGGALNGEPCASPDECQSQLCILEGSRMNPNGWVGGNCVGRCRIPAGFNTTTYFRDDFLPQGSCVAGALCMPLDGQNAEGDLGTCIDECVEDGECRPGYFCRRTWRRRFENGVCWPRDCRSGGCPSGYSCLTVNLSDGSQTGYCAP